MMFVIPPDITKLFAVRSILWFVKTEILSVGRDVWLSVVQPAHHHRLRFHGISLGRISTLSHQGLVLSKLILLLSAHLCVAIYDMIQYDLKIIGKEFPDLL